jgi:MFS family permease
LIPSELPFYLGSLGVASGALGGLAIAASTLSSAGAGLVSRRVQDRVGARFGRTTAAYAGVIALAFALMGLGYGAIAAADSYGRVLPGLVVAGFGVGLVLPTLNLWLAARVPEGSRARAIGGLTSSLYLGQFASPVLSQPLPERIGLGPTYGVVGALLVALALGVALGVRRVREPREESTVS